MRLISLRLKHFKGVEMQEVEFLPTGITIIQGPNEVGKTSLMSAFDLLIDYADNSKSREVQAAKPSGQDRATEIAARFRVKDQEFHYFKRYNREPRTELVVEQSGTRRNMAGREAHDYVKDVLTNQTDWELWKALKIVQGIAADDVAHVALGSSTSLRGALDRVAGGAEGGAADDTLFQRVKKEREEYYTPSGAERKNVFNQARARVAQLTEDIERVRLRMRDVQTQVDLFSRLEREISGVGDDVARTRGDEAAAKQSLAVIEASERLYREELQKLLPVQDELAGLRAQESKRIELSEREAALTQALATLERQIQDALSEERKAEVFLQKTKVSYAAASARETDARDAYHRLSDDVTMFMVQSELSRLDKLLADIHQVNREILFCQESLKAIRIHDEALTDLRKQDEKVQIAQSKLDVGSPTALVRALGPLTVSVNGERHVMVNEEQRHFSLSEATTVEIPGLFEMTLSPGASVSELQAKLEKEQRTLRKRLDDYRIASVREAESQYRQGEKLKAQLDYLTKQRISQLDGQEFTELEQQQVRWAAQVAGYTGGRPENYLYPASLEEAQNLEQTAQQFWNEAEGTKQASQDQLQQAQIRFNAVQKDVQALTVDKAKNHQGLAAVTSELNAARVGLPDEVLQEKVQEVSRRQQILKTQVDMLAKDLAEKNPEMVRAQFKQIETVIANGTQRLQKLRQERAECQGRLTTLGAEGLHEECEEKIALRQRAEVHLAELERRAQAANMLYDVVNACRNDQQRRYREPLRKRIAELGRVVFGSDFDVVLNENLAVVSRTLHGISLGIDVLSTGAKEQLALLVRLAAASLIEAGDGVPVILDDTLGHTDDDRFDLMVAVLNRLEATCQIILLTSATRRYTAVSGRTIDLWPAGYGIRSVGAGDVS